MAGDWIPMRMDLHEDPAVIAITAAVDGLVDEAHTCGKLLRLWGWFSAQTMDGHAVGVTKEWIDRYISATGFAAAVIQQGWLEETDSGVRQVNFASWNSESAKKRLQTSRRQQKRRSRVPDAVPVTPVALQMSRTERDKCHAESATKALPEDRIGTGEKSNPILDPNSREIESESNPEPVENAGHAGVRQVLLLDLCNKLGIHHMALAGDTSQSAKQLRGDVTCLQRLISRVVTDDRQDEARRQAGLVRQMVGNVDRGQNRSGLMAAIIAESKQRGWWPVSDRTPGTQGGGAENKPGTRPDLMLAAR